MFIVFFLCLFCLILILFCCLTAYFPKREKKKVELGGWAGGEDLEGDRGRETVIRIKHVKILFSIIKTIKRKCKGSSQKRGMYL